MSLIEAIWGGSGPPLTSAPAGDVGDSGAVGAAPLAGGEVGDGWPD